MAQPNDTLSRSRSETVAQAAARVIARLDRALPVARIAATGAEPEHAAGYLVRALSDLKVELRVLRRAARRAA